MADRPFDSSRTRVAPVFDEMQAKPDWVRRLLTLPAGGTAPDLARLDLTSTSSGHWGPNEKRLDPPVALLSWLIRNLPADQDVATSDERRACRPEEPR